MVCHLATACFESPMHWIRIPKKPCTDETDFIVTKFLPWIEVLQNYKIIYLVIAIQFIIDKTQLNASIKEYKRFI